MLSQVGRSLNVLKRSNLFSFTSSALSVPSLFTPNPINEGEMIEFNGEMIKLPANAMYPIQSADCISKYGEKGIVESLNDVCSDYYVNKYGEAAARNSYLSKRMYLDLRALCVHIWDGWWFACHFNHGFHLFKSEADAKAYVFQMQQQHADRGWFINCIGREIFKLSRVHHKIASHYKSEISANFAKITTGKFFGHGYYGDVTVHLGNGESRDIRMHIDPGCDQMSVRREIVDECERIGHPVTEIDIEYGCSDINKPKVVTEKAVDIIFEWNGIKTLCQTSAGSDLCGLGVLNRFAVTFNCKADDPFTATLHDGEVDHQYPPNFLIKNIQK